MKKRNGFIVTYALFAIALTALIGSVIGTIYVNNRQYEARMQLKDQLQADAMTIIEKINQCVVLSPGARNGDSEAFDDRFPKQASDYSVSGLTCPVTDTSSETEKSLWDAEKSGSTLRLPSPPARPGFTAWKYINSKMALGRAGVHLFIEIADADSADSIALLNSLRQRSEMQVYFPTEAVTSVSPARLYSKNLSNNQ